MNATKLRAAAITLKVATTLTDEELEAAVEAAEVVTLTSTGRIFTRSLLEADLMTPETVTEEKGR